MAEIEGYRMDLFQEWLKDRPQVVKDLAARLPPNKLYRLKTTGKIGIMHAYTEDGTVQMRFDGTYSRVSFARAVFGLDPNDIEECDFPPEDAPKGCEFTTDEEIQAHLQEVRQQIAAESN